MSTMLTNHNLATVFFSNNNNPMYYWSTHTEKGFCKRMFDEDLKAVVLEIIGSNVALVYMTTPKETKLSLGVRLPYLVLLVKNLHQHFLFEIKILDSNKNYRNFRLSNFDEKTSVKPYVTYMPMGMLPGWNRIIFNLADFTRLAYGTTYLETVRLTVHANVRVRRIYFSDRIYHDEELPREYRLRLKSDKTQSGESFKKLLNEPDLKALRPTKEMLHVKSLMQPMEPFDPVKAKAVLKTVPPLWIPSKDQPFTKIQAANSHVARNIPRKQS